MRPPAAGHSKRPERQEKGGEAIRPADGPEGSVGCQSPQLALEGSPDSTGVWADSVEAAKLRGSSSLPLDLPLSDSRCASDSTDPPADRLLPPRIISLRATLRTRCRKLLIQDAVLELRCNAYATPETWVQRLRPVAPAPSIQALEEYLEGNRLAPLEDLPVCPPSIGGAPTPATAPHS